MSTKRMSLLPLLNRSGRPASRIALGMALWMGTVALPAASAQCTVEDDFEPNDTCAMATPMHTFVTPGLTVSQGDADFYSIELPPGTTCNLGLFFSHSTADIDVAVFASCSIFVVSLTSSTSSTNNEFVSWSNATATPQEYYVRVYTNQAGACGTYSMNAEIPLCPFNDRFEFTNDACNILGNPPPVLPPGTHNALTAPLSDTDYYRVFVPDGATADVTAWFDSGGTNGNLGLEVLQTCGGSTVASSLTGTDNEDVRWTNTTGVDRLYLLKLEHSGILPLGSCSEYALTIDVGCAMDDSDEDNDSCLTALPVSPGLRTNRIARLQDEDWYEIAVPNSATLRATCLFSDDTADLDMAFYDSCGGVFLGSGVSTTDNEVVEWTNDTGEFVNVRVTVYVWSGSDGPCNTYDLALEFQGGGSENVVASCFGDGSGTQCPCSNNSAPGHLGGCAHQDGLGAILFANGIPSASAGGGPEFRLTSGPSNTFAILVSGDNALPLIGGCIGCGLLAFDGLRCVGGNFLRHGSRAINSLGNSSAGWGPPSNPSLGIAQTSGFVDGQTRHFQAFFRTDLTQTCGTGQNATNGLSVTFGP